MRRVGVTHVIVAPQHQEANDELFSRWSGLWRQLSPADPSAAMYIEDVRRRNAERNRAKAEYLKVHGTLLHAFADGCLLYRVY